MNPVIESLLSKYGLYYRVVHLPESAAGTPTAAEISRMVGIDIERIAEMFVLRCSHSPLRYLALIPSNRKLNLDALQQRVHMDQFDIQKSYLPGFDVDGPGERPSIFLGDEQVLIDETLMHFPTVLIDGGDPKLAIEVAPVGLFMFGASILQLHDESSHF